jgi:hypothetical protein
MSLYLLYISFMFARTISCIFATKSNLQVTFDHKINTKSKSK